MSSIFPQINIDTNTLIQSTTETTLPMYKEYAWDFKDNNFLLEDGKFKIVQGLEAIKIWIWKTLNTPRYRYLGYSWDYGNQLENLIGKNLTVGLAQSEAQRYLEECLLINSYIKGIVNVVTNQSEDKLNISFTANTLYGAISMNI